MAIVSLSEGEVILKRSNPFLALDFHLEFNVHYG